MLLLTLHIFIGATLSGIAIVVALVLGYASLPIILGAAVLGFVLAFPVSLVVARRLDGSQ